MNSDNCSSSLTASRTWACWTRTDADPAGNRIGLLVAVGPVRSQTLLAVRDVEASSRWYQYVLGLASDHAAPQYERLVSKASWSCSCTTGTLNTTMGIGDPNREAGNGVLLWFGEVADFDGTARE